VPAGQVPLRDYWSKLSRINWHDLFYSEQAIGVQIVMELRARIVEELKPDFVLIDSRTGITEMGGVATALLADKVICLVLPAQENGPFAHCRQHYARRRTSVFQVRPRGLQAIGAMNVQDRPATNHEAGWGWPGKMPVL
jgi:hypothetical protein